MTTHRRAWMGRAGVVVALIVGAFVALPASPAAADAPDVQITGLSSGTLTSGQRATLTFRVTNKTPKLPPMNKDAVTVRITSSFGELSCAGQCDFTDEIDRESYKEYSATLVAGTVPPGETRAGKVQVRAQIGTEAATAERDVTVRGPQPQLPPTVAEISGKVTDMSTGEPVSGAIVAIADSGNHKYDVVTGEEGRFKFTGSGTKPITPGAIQIGAAKEDVTVTKTIDVGAGKRLTGYRLVLRLSTAPSSSAAATDAFPSEPAPSDGAALTEPAQAAPEPAANEDSGGFGSLVMIIIGGVLVAFGVGAIVLLWLRRKNDNDDDHPVGPAGRPVRPAYAGADAATRLGGAGVGAHDPTMMARSGLADAPTMMHSGPLVDEFPDPYGAPLPPPQQPTYPGQPGWADNYGPGAPTRAGYGGPATPSSGGGYGTGPVSGGGYGAGPTSGGGYGAREQAGAHGQAGPGHRGGYGDRYDEPTGHYGSGEGPPYGRRGYDAGPPGEPGGRRYAPESSYDRNPGRGDDGYDDRGGYAGGHEDRGGYGDRGGYDGGYDDRGGYDEPGYDRVPGQRDAGYADRGYDRGYHDEPAGGGRRGGPPPSGRGDRRSVDWLDD
ncbi:MAG TPA: carboxypeptidase regulatory-like domain-containing protein [Micromonosporaceae bacterium]